MSENTTEAIDNLSGNLTASMGDFTTAVTNMTATFDTLVAAVTLLAAALQMIKLFELCLIIGFLVVAFWQNDIVLYLVSGLITWLIGAQWIGDYPGVTVVLWGMGTYELLKGVVMALEMGGPARGWSQIKGLFSRLRGQGE